jgi:ankyrin repeat protein
LYTFNADTQYSLLHLAASIHDVEPDLIELLVDRGADVEAIDAAFSETPLHTACRVNSPTAAAALLRRGASLSQPDDQGMLPFDYVPDVEEWIATGLFNGDVVSELRASDIRQVRRLIRTISDKVRPTSSTMSFSSNIPIIEVSVTVKVKENGGQNAARQTDNDLHETLKDETEDGDTDAVTSLSTWCRRPMSATVVHG